MKIYQLHEYGGQWEDAHDFIIGSYLKREDALEAKWNAQLEEKLLIEYSERCEDCPFIGEPAYDFMECGFPNYCSEMELEETEHGFDCKNYYYKWDESSFEIVEVEVEE